MNLWPLTPNGSFFNNWLNIMYFLPAAILFAVSSNKKYEV